MYNRRVIDPRKIEALESALWQEGDPLPERPPRRRRRSGGRRMTEFVWTLPFGALSVAARLPGKALEVAGRI